MGGAWGPCRPADFRSCVCIYIYVCTGSRRQDICPPRGILAGPHSQLWGGLEPLFFMPEEASPASSPARQWLQPRSMCRGLTPRPTLSSRAVTAGWSDRTFLDALCHGKKKVKCSVCSVLPKHYHSSNKRGGLGGERLPSLGKRGESFRSRNPW